MTVFEKDIVLSHVSPYFSLSILNICVVVWAFFVIVFLWDWNENWPFPVLWPLLHFPNLLLHSVTKLFVVFAGLILIEHVADSSSCFCNCVLGVHVWQGLSLGSLRHSISFCQCPVPIWINEYQSLSIIFNLGPLKPSTEYRFEL